MEKIVTGLIEESEEQGDGKVVYNDFVQRFGNRIHYNGESYKYLYHTYIEKLCKQIYNSTKRQYQFYLISLLPIEQTDHYQISSTWIYGFMTIFDGIYVQKLIQLLPYICMRKNICIPAYPLVRKCNHTCTLLVSFSFDQVNGYQSISQKTLHYM